MAAILVKMLVVSTHSRTEAAGLFAELERNFIVVSTHSRAKAAGDISAVKVLVFLRFNTQPREGGWYNVSRATISRYKFQHTAARRRLQGYLAVTCYGAEVSTHSRTEAAAANSR